MSQKTILPEIDHALLVEVDMVTTGADVHAVAGEKCAYVNMRDAADYYIHRCEEDGETVDAARLASLAKAIEDGERRLRRRVMVARQARLSAAGAFLAFAQ